MPKQNRLFYSEKARQWLFICPGCDAIHGFDATWSFNNDLVKPTVNPSLLVTAPGGRLPRCHSFIENGEIRFLDDSTHALKGQTIAIPVWDRVGDY